MANWKEHSRTGWSDPTLSNEPPIDDRIKIGCLQRIADATELMAKNHSDLVAREKYQRERAESNWQEVQRLRRSNAALRGLLGKKKRRTRKDS